MSTTKTCDICHQAITDYHQHIMLINIGGDVGNMDLCFNCWHNPTKWKKIHTSRRKKLDLTRVAPK